MKVLVTGATGFTGSHVVPRLLQENLEVSCFVRSTSDFSSLPVSQVRVIYGDLSDPASLTTALAGMDVLINIASLGFGHAENIVSAAVQAGVSKAIFISTTAIFTQLNVNSKSTRLAAESTITQSQLPYTILRPTMIYGSIRDRNMYRLIRYLLRWPIIPIFGDGRSLQQPVYVEDVAQAVAQSLLSKRTVNKAYNISGADPLTYTQVIDTICEQIKRKVQKIYVPYSPIAKGLSMMERVQIPFPVKAEQILRLNENKNFAHSDATDDFGYRPHSFAEGISFELATLSHKQK